MFDAGKSNQYVQAITFMKKYWKFSHHKTSQKHLRTKIT